MRVASVMDKMRETRLRWYQHVKRIYSNAPVKRCERLAITSFSGGGDRLKKNYGELIGQNIVHLQLTEDMFLDRKVLKVRNYGRRPIGSQVLSYFYVGETG